MTDADGGFFSSEPFLGAVAEVYFPGEPWRREDVAVAGQRFRVLVVGRNHVVGRVRVMPVFYRPLGPATGTERRLAGLPSACRAVIPAREWLAMPRSRFSPSPFVDFTRFATWEAYLGDSEGWHGPRHWYTERARDARRLAREAGPVEFTFADKAGGLVPLLLGWKARQLDTAGEGHPFHNPLALQLYEALRARGVLEAATVRAGGRLVAGALHTSWGGTVIFRLTVFDPAFAKHSPGTLVLHGLLEHAYRHGMAEADLLLGDEAYKWRYATDVRGAGHVGRPPWREQVVRHLGRIPLAGYPFRFTDRRRRG